MKYLLTFFCWVAVPFAVLGILWGIGNLFGSGAMSLTLLIGSFAALVAWCSYYLNNFDP